MYNFKFNNVENTSQYEELIKEFLQPNEYGEGGDTLLAYDFKGDKEEIKRQIYRDLSGYTGKSPKWGILTGIRPVKLAGELLDRGEDPEQVLKDLYLVDASKAALVRDILDYQREKAGKPGPKSLSVYIGIPFCPTRCLYCSFTSNQIEQEQMEPYLNALCKEISYAGTAAKAAGYNVETLYFGGGTPTSLSANQLDMLLTKVSDAFALGGVREYTVEAGRPDTITEDKLQVLFDHGVDRISINPQSMKQKTLDLIGRRHTVEDVYKAFELAWKTGIEVINTDLIAGLPEETVDDFKESLEEIIRLGAGNITLHTLAVKRASKLKELDENFNYRDELLREEMLNDAHQKLRANGFRPYYLYRQKHTSGNTENTGFCKEDKASIYNIRIMEEAQSILALGAGGISKVYYPAENRLERVANVSNYQIYIERIDEMINRKRTGGIVSC